MSVNAASPGVGNGDVIAVSATCGYTGGSTCSPGNDGNDGLSPATPLLTPSRGLSNLFNSFNLNGKLPSLNLAHGLNPGFLCASGPLVGNAAFPITGDNNSINAVKISGAVSVKDYCFVTLRSLEIDGGSQTDINCDFYGGIDMRSVTLGPTTGAGASADHGCVINFIGQDGSAATNSLQLGAGAAVALQTYRGGHITLSTPTNIPSNVTVSVAFYFTQGGYIDGLTGTPFTGAGVVTGPKCNIADTSSSFDGNPNTYFPGSSNCSYPYLPTPTSSTLGGIESIVATAHQWIDSISTSGAPHQSQPACGDLSNAAATCSSAAWSGITGTPTTLGGYGIAAAAGIDENILNTQISNYSVAATDCGKTIQLGTGSTGQFTLTLPAVTGFPSNCSVLIKNGDSTNAKFLSGFPSDLFAELFPGQSAGVKIVNGAWQSFYNPGLWVVSAATTLYVNGNSGATAVCGNGGGLTCAAGNDANDCLQPATACLTAQRALNLYLNHIHSAGFGNTINLAHGSSQNYAMVCEGGPFLGTSVIQINGDSTAATSVAIVPPPLGNAIAFKDGCTLGFNNVAFADNGSSNGGNFIIGGVGAPAHVDLNNVSFGALTSGIAINLTYGASVTIDGPCFVTGNMVAFLYITSGGVLDPGVACTGSAGLAFSSAFAIIGTGGIINGGQALSAASPSFPGFSGIIARRCNISGAFVLAGLENPNSFFPGSSDCVPISFVGTIGVPSGSGASSSFDFGTSHWPIVSGGGSNANNKFEQLQNFGMASGGANTVKCSLNGTNEVDCTASQIAGITEQGMTLLNVVTVSAAANISDTSSFTSAYNDYLIMLDNIVPATNGVNFNCQVQSGGSFQSYQLSGTTLAARPRIST